MESTQHPAARRWGIYWIIIITALGGSVGRILNVVSRDGDAPFLSANDRSRWATIRSLGDHGTFEIDEVIVRDPSAQRRWERFDHRWYSIDMVRHKGNDGKEHYYSSKPPLLPTMLAAVYWVVKLIAGETLATQPFYIVRAMLILANVIPLGFYLWTIALLADRYGRTDWGRCFVVAAASWGTMLSPFVVSLNNHLPAVVSVAFALYAALAIWRGETSWRYFVSAGLFAAFAVANELPALAFAAAITAVIIYKSPLKAIGAYAPAAAVVAVLFFYMNITAHHSLRPPYMHRSDGKTIAVITDDLEQLQTTLAAGQTPPAVTDELSKRQHDISDRAFTSARLPLVKDGLEQQRWMLWDTVGQDRFSLVLTDAGLEVREWDNWYEYSGSYWSAPERAGVDAGESSRVVYLFHMLLGHHGVFSVTPIWLLALAGAVLCFTDRTYQLQAPALLALLLSVVCVGFYFMRPEIDRNYGGVSCCMRWLLWLIPLWLVCLIPAADAMSQTAPRRVGAASLLGISSLSAAYSAMNPWAHPWIYDYWSYLGWIEYP